jgi:hypothetical protein
LKFKFVKERVQNARAERIRFSTLRNPLFVQVQKVPEWNRAGLFSPPDQKCCIYKDASVSPQTVQELKGTVNKNRTTNINQQLTVTSNNQETITTKAGATIQIDIGA